MMSCSGDQGGLHAGDLSLTNPGGLGGGTVMSDAVYWIKYRLHCQLPSTTSSRGSNYANEIQLAPKAMGVGTGEDLIKTLKVAPAV